MSFRLLSLGVVALAIAPALTAQTGQAPKQPSMLDQSPQPPGIAFGDETLTIRATNSSLRTILDDIHARTGAVVKGLSKDERVFGIYGPGKPQAVLASLLDDSGYNVVISGEQADGAPREVLLSARSSAAAPVNASGNITQAGQDFNEAQAEEPRRQRLFLAPHRPSIRPAEAPPGGSPQQIKTPQQLLQELQRLRQQSLSQQAAPK